MSGRDTAGGEHDRGAVLASCLVLLLALTLAASSAAVLARADLALVRGLGESRRALYVAEAGVTEALLRLEIPPGTRTVTVGAGTFDPAIVPNAASATWRAVVHTGIVTPRTVGSTFETPSIQAPATALPYTTATASADALTLRWDLVSPGVIRTAPGGTPILLVESVGRVGRASRRVTRAVTRGSARHFVLEPANDVCPTMKVDKVAVSITGELQINGACTEGDRALLVDERTLSTTGAIRIVGDFKTKGGAVVSPAPVVGAATVADPLASLAAPNVLAMTIRSGSLFAPTLLDVQSSQTLQPGAYYGGIKISKDTTVVTLAPGTYALAGGGLEVKDKATLRGSGVTIYNTGYAAGFALGFDKITFDGDATIDLAAPAGGVVLFQDRRNTKDLELRNKGSTTLTGAIYAKVAKVKFEDTARTLAATLVVGRVEIKENLTLVPSGVSSSYTQVAWSDA